MEVTKDTTIGELVKKHPHAAYVLLSRGLHCLGCAVGYHETIEQGAKAHGLTDEDIKNMVHEINETIKLAKK